MLRLCFLCISRHSEHFYQRNFWPFSGQFLDIFSGGVRFPISSLSQLSFLVLWCGTTTLFSQGVLHSNIMPRIWGWATTKSSTWCINVALASYSSGLHNASWGKWHVLVTPHHKRVKELFSLDKCSGSMQRGNQLGCKVILPVPQQRGKSRVAWLWVGHMLCNNHNLLVGDTI